MKRTIVISLLTLSLVTVPVMAEAGFLFHATKKALAKRIMARGFSRKLMSPSTRFGKGAYLSKSPVTALREKPKADALVVFRDSKNLRNNAINVRNIQKDRIKALSGDTDLRGNIRKGVIGPDLGKKVANTAKRSDKSVLYRSARDPKGTNVFIPAQVYKKHPRIVTPTGTIQYVK